MPTNQPTNHHHPSTTTIIIIIIKHHTPTNPTSTIIIIIIIIHQHHAGVGNSSFCRSSGTLSTTGSGAAAGPAEPAHPPARLKAEGTSSTPAVIALPQLGSAGVVCGRDWTAQPFFYAGPAGATEEVRIRAGVAPLVEEELSPAQQLALPFGHYRTVVFRVRQGTQAREIVATVTAEVVAGTFKVRGVPEALGACYVKRWSVAMNVNPY